MVGGRRRVGTRRRTSAVLPQVRGAPNLLLCRRDLDNATAERTVQLLVHSTAELIPQSSLGVQFLSAERLINTAGVPLHLAAADA